MHETSDGVLNACDLVPQQIQSIHVGNAFGECFNQQSHLGAMLAAVDARYHGTPAARHEAACASGSIAALAAMAENNIANAKRNLNAQTRHWQYQANSFSDDDEANPVVEGWLRRQDCAQVTDGGAAVVLASGQFAQSWATQHGLSLDQLPRIAGWGHRTAGLALQPKFAFSDEYVFPHVRQAVQDALRRAGLVKIGQVAGVELHDCFSMTQYLAIDHLGITPAGQSWRAIESGELAFGGKLPLNPSGGLMGGGHPVGASGVRMLWDAARQVQGSAGAYQVEGVRRFATLNIGGSLSTVVSFVVQQG